MFSKIKKRLRRYLVVFSQKLLPEKTKDGDEEDYQLYNKAKPGTVDFIIQVEERRSIKVVCSISSIKTEAFIPEPMKHFVWFLYHPMAGVPALTVVAYAKFIATTFCLSNSRTFSIDW